MAQTNYINFADYLDINQDEIRRMEEAMRAEEQRRLAEAVNATNAAGQSATEAAYWGEGGADLMEYGDYQKALSKQEGAKRWQDALKTDKGQQELLTKLYGGQASALEAGLLFGSQEGGQKTKLGEYMGIDSSEFERDLNSNWANELKGSAADFQRELAKKRASQAEWADYEGKKAEWDKAENERLAEFQSRKRKTLEAQLEKKRQMGRDFYASPDWNDWMNYLSGSGDWDKSKEREYQRRVLAGYKGLGDRLAPEPPAPPSRYSGRLTGTRADYERAQREKEEAEQRKMYERYSYGGGYY